MSEDLIKQFEELKATEPESSEYESSEDEMEIKKKVKLMERVYEDITTKNFCKNPRYDDNLNFKSKDDKFLWDFLPLTNRQKEQLLEFILIDSDKLKNCNEN